MIERSSALPPEDPDYRATRGQPVETPSEHQGLRNSFARCFAVEALPEDFCRLLSRMH